MVRAPRASLAVAVTLAAACSGPQPGAPRARAHDAGAAVAPDAAVEPVDVPDGVVDVRALDPSLHVDLMYLGAANVLGRRVDGYHANVCYLTAPAARAVVAAQARLRRIGQARGRRYSLLLRDCYRPRRAVADFLRWIEDEADTSTRDAYYPGLTKAQLVEQGYIAPVSGHSRGGAVDVTIVEVGADGAVTPLDMGTPIDFFGARSHTAHARISPEARAARDLLVEVMAPELTNLPVEWWHFSLTDNDRAPMDFEVRPAR